MLNTLSVNLNTDLKVTRVPELGIKIKSQDINNNLFILRFTDEGKAIELDETYTVEILTKFEKSKSHRLTSATVYRDYARWEFDTSFITQDEKVTNYVYVRKAGSLVVSADANAFAFDVGLSEIDKDAGRVAEVYDENYQQYLDEFKDNVDFEEIAQAEQARKEAELLREENYEQKVDAAIVEADVVAKVDNKVTELAPQINNLTAQLAQKADYDKVRLADYKFEMEDMSDEVVSAITGGATVNVLSEPQDKSVSFKKTTFLETGKNLLNTDAVETEATISSTTGLVARHPTNVVTDFIEILPDMDYYYSDSAFGLLKKAIAYDSNKEPILSSYDINVNLYHTPSNAKYVKLEWNNDAEFRQFERGSVNTVYAPHGYQINKRLPISGDEIKQSSIPNEALSPLSVSLENVDFFDPVNNLFNKEKRTISGFISNQNGTITSNATYDTTDYIYVEGGQSYVISPRIRQMLLYDVQKTPLMETYVSSASENHTFTPTVNGFIRATLWAEAVDIFKIEKGTVPTPYKPFEIQSKYLGFNEKQNQTIQNMVAEAQTTSDLTINKDGEMFTFESSLGDDNISIETTRNGSKNGGFNIGYTRINNEVIHPVNDDVTPIRLFYTVGANHGYGVLQVTQSGFSVSDLGSQWTDGERMFTLVNVDGDIIQLAPEYTEVTDGTISVDYPTPVGDLTHVSGGTNTSTIVIASHSISELIPSIKNNSVKYIADGKEITVDGEYHCKELQIIESYEVLDYKDIIDYMQSNIGSPFDPDNIESVIRLSNVFTYTKGLNCSTTHGLKAMKKVKLERCGFLQSSALEASGYTRKRFMQNVRPKNGYDFSVGVDLDAFNTSTYFYADDLTDPSTLPTHYTDWLYSNGNKKYGFTMGYIVDKTNSKTADRLNNTTMFWDMRSSKKSYPVAISGGVLDVGDYKNFAGFRNYLTSGDVGQATTLTTVKDKKDVYLYADYNVIAESFNKPLNDELGKTITRIQGDLNSLNDTVDSEGVVLSSTSEISSGVFKIN